MKAYKAIHKLMVQLEAPGIMRDYEFFIGLTKEGAIQMIPKVTLENLRSGEIKFYEEILRMLQDLITEEKGEKMLSGVSLISSKISERRESIITTK